MSYKAILMDLDGTLLPMDAEEFTRFYFPALCKKMGPFGYEPKALVAAIWSGVKEIIKSDGASTGEERFWKEFARIFGNKVYADKLQVDGFYTNEFNMAKAICGENPLARPLVELAHKKAPIVILATNPIFPYPGQLTRLSWLGLGEKDFSFITSYENSIFAKPDPRYFRELLNRFDLRPEDCVMLGNDVEEDIRAAQAVGIRTFLITDCQIGDASTVTTEQGSFAEALTWLEQL